MRAALLLLALAATGGAAASTPDAALRGYVLGRYASADDQPDAAGRYFADALAAEPSLPLLARRAFDVALTTGDSARAVALARQLTAADAGDSETALVLLADAINRRDWPAATQARAGIASAGYAAVIEPIVGAWTLFARKDHEAALERLDPAGFTGFARSYVAEQRAHMLAADRQFEAAATAYADLRAISPGNTLLRLGEADALAQSGDKNTAIERLAGDDPARVAARQRLAAGRRIGALAPDARHGLGLAMARLATDLSRERPTEASADQVTDLALVFARVASMLAPGSAPTWLVVADVLAGSDRNEAALAALNQIDRKDPMLPAAAARRAQLLEAMGRDAEAGALLQAASTAPGAGAESLARLGDWHRRADRFGAAAEAYGRAIALAEAETDASGADAWGLYFLRGTMRERGGDWPGAESDMRAALERSPEEPIVLNYLGYSMLDRGLDGAEASALIARAARLRPGDGGIVDSLGWSQFHAGRFAEAVVTLEKAATLEPTDPTIVDHLGDAYWQVGRRIEARFRWRAALALEPDATLKAALTKKLEIGRDAALALQVSRQ